jgi:hypothetical protein
VADLEVVDVQWRDAAEQVTEVGQVVHDVPVVIVEPVEDTPPARRGGLPAAVARAEALRAY